MSHALVIALGNRDSDPDHHYLVAPHRSRLSSAAMRVVIAMRAAAKRDPGPRDIRNFCRGSRRLCSLALYGNGGWLPALSYKLQATEGSIHDNSFRAHQRHSRLEGAGNKYLQPSGRQD